jgi:acetyl-CoA C-acetyltransferase
MTACIVGWAHTPFGKLNGETVESLIVRVTGEALADAGIGPKDVDEIVLGHFNAGFSAQDFTASLVLQAAPELRFKRATRVENACATGSAAVHQGIKAIDARAARVVLVVGAEQMTTTPAAEIGRNLLKASYVREEAEIDGGFAGIFGKIAGFYFQKWGDQSDALAMIAAKNHKNGVGNPYAQMRKDLGYDFCRTESEKNPFVAGPLKRTDCSLVSDGAAAVVLADVETALKLKKAVTFRAVEHVQDFLPMSKRDILKFEGCAEAWRRALAKAGLKLDELSFVETHDCFTIAELIEYEAMGLTAEGQGARAVLEGWTQKDARALRDAAHRHCGRPAGEERTPGRYLQYGWNVGRELREYSRAHQVTAFRTQFNLRAVAAGRNDESKISSSFGFALNLWASAICSSAWAKRSASMPP